MKPTGKERIRYIIKAIDKIAVYTSGLKEDEFLQSDLIIDAVLYQFTIIGEAVIHINQDVLAKYPYPWHLVRGFRNYIAHEYFGITMSIVWQTIKPG